jgi:hypothetical protein
MVEVGEFKVMLMIDWRKRIPMNVLKVVHH